MTPKLGISVRSLDRYANDIDARLAEVMKYSPDSIELMCFAQDLIRNGKVIAGRAELVCQALEKYRVKATMHGPLSLNLLDRRDNLDCHVTAGMAYLDLASTLGVTAMVIHTGYCEETNFSELKTKYRAQRDGLKRLADRAGQDNIMVFVENIFPFWEGAHTALPSQLAEEIVAIDHPNILACFDVSHGYIACNAYGAELVQQATDINSVAPHWHVHDSFGRPDTSLKPYTKSEVLAYGIGDLHLAVGDGDLPWGEVLAAAGPGAGTTFNIELNPDLWPDMQRCVDATRRMIDSVDELKAA